MRSFILLCIFSLLSCSPLQQLEKDSALPPLDRQRLANYQFFFQSTYQDSADLPDDSFFSQSGCAEFKAHLPKDFVIGTLDVPENWDEPESPKISIFYYGQLINGKDPVIFYNGGPGSDSHAAFRSLRNHPDFSKFSFIFMDQRGTGCSSPYPQEAKLKNLERLLLYGSYEIVKDSEALRKKILGPNFKWKIFGQSFGGRIVHRYLQLAPEGIQSAHSHGFSVMANDYEWLARRLLSQKRVFQTYLKKYPEDEKKILKIQGLIPESQCFSDENLEVCGPRVLDAFVMMLGFRTSWSRMHNILDQLLDETGNLKPAALEEFVHSFVLGLYGYNYAASTAITMADFSEDIKDLNICRRPLEILKKRGEDSEKWPLNECRLMPHLRHKKWSPVFQEYSRSRGGFAKPLYLEKIKDSLTQNAALKFYLYSGEVDVFVPIEAFQEEVQSLSPLVQYTQFQKSGHEGFLTEGLIWRELAQ